eukprot:1135750-Amorphochlora_amoeboformis.AAC.1
MRYLEALQRTQTNPNPNPNPDPNPNRNPAPSPQDNSYTPTPPPLNMQHGLDYAKPRIHGANSWMATPNTPNTRSCARVPTSGATSSSTMAETSIAMKPVLIYPQNGPPRSPTRRRRRRAANVGNLPKAELKRRRLSNAK